MWSFRTWPYTCLKGSLAAASIWGVSYSESGEATSAYPERNHVRRPRLSVHPPGFCRVREHGGLVAVEENLGG